HDLLDALELAAPIKPATAVGAQRFDETPRLVEAKRAAGQARAAGNLANVERPIHAAALQVNVTSTARGIIRRGPLHRPNEQAPHLRPALLCFAFDAADDLLDLSGKHVVTEVDIHQHRDLVGRAMDGEHIADAHDPLLL